MPLFIQWYVNSLKNKAVKPLFKYNFRLALFILIIIAVAKALKDLAGLNISINDVIILTASFALIAFLTVLIFFKGQKKEPESQTLHLLVAISLKFLLDMSLALAWFIVTKKTAARDVLLFFVIYLSLTLFSILIIVKTLKNKAL